MPKVLKKLTKEEKVKKEQEAEKVKEGGGMEMKNTKNRIPSVKATRPKNEQNERPSTF